MEIIGTIQKEVLTDHLRMYGIGLFGYFWYLINWFNPHALKEDIYSPKFPSTINYDLIQYDFKNRVPFHSPFYMFCFDQMGSIQG